MGSYRCWVPDYGHEPEDGWTYAQSWGVAEDAVKEYARRKFADWEYPDEIEIAVQEVTSSGEPASRVRTFVVTSEPVPYFYATEKATPPHGEKGRGDE
jgi:hypothetical protein